MIVIACGGREFFNKKLVARALTIVKEDAWANNEELVVVNGGAPGADTLAKNWANSGIPGVWCVTVEAPWDWLKRAAGPRRNAKMLELLEVELVVAFPGGTGTADMVKKATKAGIRVMTVDDE